MAFNRNKSQLRTEPTFVFVARKRDARTPADRQRDNAEEESFTIPAFLRTGPLSARMNKTSKVTFKLAAKDKAKAKMSKAKTPGARPAEDKSPKAETIGKAKSSAQTQSTTAAKSATSGWFDNDFERIAETAKPKYMTGGSDELTEPAEPILSRVTHAAAFDTGPKVKPAPEGYDDVPDDIFFFEDADDAGDMADADDANDPEDEDNPNDWQEAPFFANSPLSTPSSDEFRVPYDDHKLRYRLSFFVASRLPLIAVVGLGLYAGTYLWPTENPDQATSAITTREPPAPVAQPTVDPRTIVPAGPGQLADINKKAPVDVQKVMPEHRVMDVTPKIPMPKNRPSTNASAPEKKTTKQIASSEPSQSRRVVLAPGPRPLSPYYSSSSNGSGSSNSSGTSDNNGPSEREEALLSDLAVDVQRNLAVLGYAGVPQTGRLDAATRGAIRSFQSNSGLPPTGEVDSRTLRLMNSMSHIQ